MKDYIIFKSQNNEFFEKYVRIVVDTIEGVVCSDWSLGWYKSSYFKGNKIDQIDVVRYIALHDKAECNDFIENLLIEEMVIFEKLKEVISKVIV